MPKTTTVMTEPSAKIRVFISWSGELSKTIAREFRSFLPRVIQSIEPWLSSQDISQGSFWQQAVGDGLAGSRIGLVILTAENVDRPWLHYEVGYLTRHLETGEGLVAPLVIDIPTSAVVGPMTSLQVTSFNRDAVWKLMHDINGKLTDPLGAEILEKSFGYAWPELEVAVTEAVKLNEGPSNPQSTFMLEPAVSEILNTVRQLARTSVTPQTVERLIARRTPDSRASTQMDRRRRRDRYNLVEEATRRHGGRLIGLAEDIATGTLTAHVEPVTTLQASELVMELSGVFGVGKFGIEVETIGDGETPLRDMSED